MKFRTTQRDINTEYPHRIAVGYCTLQSLLAHKNPIAYTVRKEGWGADIYEVSPTVAIVTGYAPFGNVRPSYDLCREYEEMADGIRCNVFDYEERKRQLNRLLTEFVREVLGE